MGRSFILVRTPKAQEVFQNMVKDKVLTEETLDINKLSEIQQNHYQRRIYAGYRLLPIQLISGYLFSFKDLNLLFLMKHLSFLKGIRAIMGVIKRSLNRNNYYDGNTF